MRYYFKIQIKRIIRHIADFGVKPIIGIPLLIALFIFTSYAIFNLLDFPEYIYSILGIFYIGSLGNKEKNSFLKRLFSKKEYYKVRIIENLIFALPFVIFLLIMNKFLLSIGFILMVVLLAFLHKGTGLQLTLPTPFGRYPFEFTSGFRSSIITIIIAFSLAIISAIAGNYNLAVFSIILLNLTCLYFYIKPEPEYFIWVHSYSPQSFLFHKIKIAILYTFLLNIPVICFVALIFTGSIKVLLIIQICGFLLIILGIVSKYSNFPSEINLPQTLSIILSIGFPPLLIAFIPFYYFRSIKRLKEILQ